MILSRLRNVSPCRFLADPRIDIFTRRRWCSGTLRVSYRFFFRYHYSSGNFRHWFFHVVFSPGAVGIVRRIVFRSLLWFASLGLSSGHGHSQQDTRLSNFRRFTSGPSSVDIHTSLADGFYVPASHLFPFLHLFPHLNVSVSPAHFRIACFRISHHPSYFGPRDIGSVQKELTRQHTSKTNHPLKPQLSHVYTMTLPSFRLRATFTYEHNYPPASAYLCVALRHTCRAFISFCVLGSWDSRRDISFITLSSFYAFMPRLFGFTVP